MPKNKSKRKVVKSDFTEKEWQQIQEAIWEAITEKKRRKKEAEANKNEKGN